MSRTVESIEFIAALQRPRESGGWKFLQLPMCASEKLRTRGHVSVELRCNRRMIVVTLQPDGEGGHWLRLEEDVVSALGLVDESEAEFEISPVPVEPEPAVPEDLKLLLSASDTANGTWLQITALARRDWIIWMGSGRKPETRKIRLEKMMDMLAKGKKRVCCFDRSGIYSKEFSCPEAAD